MGLVLLAVAYVALAAALALPAMWWGGPRGGAGGGRSVGGGLSGLLRRLLAGGGVASAWSALFLTALPLAFVSGAFLPGKTLAPTPMLAGVPPWAAPARTQAIVEGSSPPNPLLLDPTSQFLPWRQAARDDLLLNPAAGSGAALLANGQSAVLFPTEIVARWLPPFRGVGFSQAARLLVAAWGMFLLARALAASEAAALAAAVVWTGAGFVQLWRLHPHSLVAATLPWIVWAALTLARRPGPRPAVALAAAGALGLFAGHPETLLHGVLFAAAVGAAVLVVDPREPARAWRDGLARRLGGIAVWGAAAAALSALLAAPLLLPFVENLVVSHEWRSRAVGGTVVEVPLAESLERLKPALALRALGNNLAGTWTGLENMAELGGGAVGAGALLLAVLAPLAARGRRRRWAAVVLAIGLVGLAVSVHLVGVSRPFGEVPVLRESLLKRMSLWWALAVPLAAAVAVDAWRGRLAAWRREEGGLGGWWGRVAAAALVVALAVAWAGGPPWRAPLAVQVAEWGALAAAAGALVVPLRARLSAILLLLALLLPRVPLFDRWVPLADPASFYAETDATRFVAERLAEDGPQGFRVAGWRGALVPHAASFFGFEEARIYDPMAFAPYVDFLLAFGPRPPWGWIGMDDPLHPALAFLGVRWYFGPPSGLELAGLRRAYDGPDGSVYELPAALPRLFVPRHVEVYPDAASAVAAGRALADFAERATVVASPAAGLAAGTSLANPPARVHELVVAGRRVSARVTAPRPAIVASSQPAIPGWRVEIDGDRVEPLSIHGAFVGVAVPAGEHRVELVYAPASWRVGLGLSAVGVLLAGLLLRRRRPG